MHKMNEKYLNSKIKFCHTFALPNTETDTVIDKFTQNPMGICVDVSLCAVWTPPHNTIQPILLVSVLVSVAGMNTLQSLS